MSNFIRKHVLLGLVFSAWPCGHNHSQPRAQLPQPGDDSVAVRGAGTVNYIPKWTGAHPGWWRPSHLTAISWLTPHWMGAISLWFARTNRQSEDWPRLEHLTEPHHRMVTGRKDDSPLHAEAKVLKREVGDTSSSNWESFDALALWLQARVLQSRERESVNEDALGRSARSLFAAISVSV